MAGKYHHSYMKLYSLLLRCIFIIKVCFLVCSWYVLERRRVSIIKTFVRVRPPTGESPSRSCVMCVCMCSVQVICASSLEGVPLPGARCVCTSPCPKCVCLPFSVL